MIDIFKLFKKKSIIKDKKKVRVKIIKIWENKKVIGRIITKY
jgi:hypothetical protein